MIETAIKKLYYSIGEVSELTGLRPYVLRYWETEFPMLSPQKNRAGNRVYRDREIKLLFHIKYLLYDQKYTIEGARQQLKDYDPDSFVPTGSAPDSGDGEAADEVKRLRAGLKDVKKRLQKILKMLDLEKKGAGKR